MVGGLRCSILRGVSRDDDDVRALSKSVSNFLGKFYGW